MYWHPRFWKMIDWPLFAIVLAITAVGFVVISSAAPSYEVKADLIKQAAALIMGMVAWAILVLLDYNELRTLHWWVYAFNIAMLFAVVAFGVEVMGNKNWLDLGVIMVQPSELGKVLLIVTLAKQLDDMERLEAWWHLAPPILHVMPVLGAVVLQKDLGTALVFAVIGVVMVYGRGFPGRKLLAAGVLAAAFVVGSVWSHYTYGTVFPLNINPGQWNRIDAFLYPEKDPEGAGYQVLQSKMAIASGDIWGKGYGKGEYQQNGWLPFPHTDFVFAALVEEWGFVGGAVLLGLYALLFLRLAVIAFSANDRYGTLIVVGVAALFGAHVLENVGMTMGLMPVTGIPLPFVSYGPTALVANMAAIGLTQSVAARREPLPYD
nr:rod shape-determining protein RodA [Symbiobacterium terraclitae]